MDGAKLGTLQSSRVDTAVSLAKGILGAIPVGGSFFAEIIGLTIPNQRLDRVTGLMIELDRRLENLERQQLKNNKYALDLFEDGVIQASRALSEQRNRYIAIFIKRSIGADEDSYGIRKKLLHILQELSDRDIEILQKIAATGYQTVERAYYPGHLTVKQYEKLSKNEKYEFDARQVSWSAHVSTLERLGLLEAEREKPVGDTAFRHIDEDTGLPRIVGYSLSKLGNVFLQSIV